VKREASYLNNGWEESRWWRMVKFRLGNKMRKERYWRKKVGCVDCVGMG